MTTFDAEHQDFTPRDFQALDARLQDLQSSVLPNLDDPAVLAVVNYIRSTGGFVGSVVDYYMTALKREHFVPTMRELRSAILHGKRQGYQVAGASAATADLTVTIQNAPLTGSITFAAKDKVKTAEVPTSISGEIQSAVVAAPGATTVQLSWRHSISKQKTYTSTGKKGQKFRLPETPYLDGSVTGSSAAGDWEQVDNFLNSRATDRHFTVFVDQNNQATITTGDDKNGAIPRGQITFSYETGGGTSGNVDKNSLTKFSKDYYDSNGTKAILTVTNPNRADGGLDRETVNAAKINIPNNRRLPVGTIAEEDFEIRAVSNSGVGRALFLSADRDGSVPVNEGRLFIVPPLGGEASQTTKDEVLELVTVTYPTTPTYTIQVANASYLVVNIFATVYLRKSADPVTVRTAINTNLTAWFKPLNDDQTPNTNIDFGWNYKDQNDNPSGLLAFSRVMDVIHNTTGVFKLGPGLDECTINGKRSDVIIGNFQFPQLGTVELINGDTGKAL
jgi:hypothetical protein